MVEKKRNERKREKRREEKRREKKGNRVERKERVEKRVGYGKGREIKRGRK